MILLKIDKEIKGKIYHAAKFCNKLETIFKADFDKFDSNYLIVDLSIIDKKQRIKFNLGKLRRTSYYNTKNRVSVRSFYIYSQQLELDFYD